MIRDLTKGKPSSVLLKFSLPMFVSVMFQQFYNMADSMVAGKFAGEDALAAVGASYPITMIFMAVAVGSNIGCSVVISQFFGAREYKKVRTSVYTTLIFSTIISLVLTFLGIFFSTNLMNMIKTPQNIFSDAQLYLRIYIAGFIFLFIYNVCTGIFQSLGDSKTPLWFLIGSSIGNVILDIIFVAVFHWGVAGVAWATFIAQTIACILAFVTVLKRVQEIPVEGKVEIMSWKMVGEVSKVAIPSILQQSFVSIGNIFIQSIINSFGSSVIAGYSAAIKLNTFSITSLTTLANGVSGFTAQNIGAKQSKRVRQGFKASLVMGACVAAAFTVMFVVFPQFFIKLFMDKGGAALDTGVRFLRIVAPFYLIISIKLMADGVLRGAGAMNQFMVATFTDLVLRVILSFVLAPIFGTDGVWFSWPIGWSIAAVTSFVFYISGSWDKENKKAKAQQKLALKEKTEI